jgi:hypothetical protein
MIGTDCVRATIDDRHPPMIGTISVFNQRQRRDEERPGDFSIKLI